MYNDVMDKDLILDITKNTVIRTEANFYKLLVEHIGEEITVSDGDGNYLFVNTESVEMIGMPVYEIVGKNALELEEKGYFSRSVTLETLKQRKKVNILQKLKSGRTIIATGVPIFDKNGEDIVMVISTSKDVEEVNNLLTTIEDQVRELSLKNAEIEKLRDDVFAQQGFLYADPLMREIRDAVMRIAPLDVTVLIEGETGVGKEVVAKTLHRFSARSNEPFVKINCGIIPENLIEAELFGYDQGAFTGANKQGKKGLVEIADGGTLFLDEIGEMPLSMQVKLLDFIQDGSYIRVGGSRRNIANTRILVATNRNLQEMCNQGLFRKDLYYRLKVVPLTIPPLRERTGDIPMLTKYFITRYNEKYKAQKTIDAHAARSLYTHYWPGNVRELEHVLERAFIMTDGHQISENIVNGILRENTNNGSIGGVICTGLMPLKDAKHEVERQLLAKALGTHKTTYQIAEALGVDQSTIVKLLKRINQPMQ